MKKPSLRTIIIIVLTISTVVAIYWLSAGVHSSIRDRKFGPRHFNSENRQAFIKANPVQTWMTFSYINAIYHLPSDYLRTTLIIPDTRYPNIRLDVYAKSINISPAEIQQQVQAAIESNASNPAGR